MNTDRVLLSRPCRNHVIGAFFKLGKNYVFTLRYEIAADHYRSLGWDLVWDREHYTYSIPEHQVAFFLLSIEDLS